MPAFYEYDTLDDVKDVEDLEGLVVSPLAHLSAHMYGVTVAGRHRGPDTPVATQGEKAVRSWGRAVAAGTGARVYVRFWPKGVILAYPKPTTPMIVAVRVEHVRVHGTQCTTSVASSVAILLPIEHFERGDMRTRLRARDASLWIPASLHDHAPTKPNVCGAGILLEQAMLANLSPGDEKDARPQPRMQKESVDAFDAIRALRNEFRSGFMPLRNQMGLIKAVAPRAARQSVARTGVAAYELDEGPLAAAAMTSLLGREFETEAERERTRVRPKEQVPTAASWEQARLSEGARFSGLCAEVGCREVPLHLAAAEVLGLADMSTLLALRSMDAMRDALPRPLQSVRGYPLLVAAALRMACAPGIYDMYRSADIPDDGCAELNERFVAQWRPLIPDAAGHALFGIDIVLLKSIADANAEIQEGGEGREGGKWGGAAKAARLAAARPVGLHRGASRAWAPRVHANLASLARSAHRIAETLFASGAYLSTPDVVRLDAHAYGSSPADMPLAVDIVRVARQEMMSDAAAEAAARSHAGNRQECPWPFVALPPEVARDGVVALLDDAERYCRRVAGYTAVGSDGDDGVDDVRGGDDDSDDDGEEQEGAVDLSWRMRSAYLSAAHGDALPSGAALGLTDALAKQGILSHLDPFQNCAPSVATLSQKLGDSLLSACITHGAADIATNVGLVSRMVSPHSTTSCFVCKKGIFGLETLVTLPYSQCIECERYRCYRCVQAVPRPVDLRCAECAIVLDNLRDDDD